MPSESISGAITASGPKSAAVGAVGGDLFKVDGDVYLFQGDLRREGVPSAPLEELLTCDPVPLRETDPFVLGVTPALLVAEFAADDEQPYVDRDLDHKLVDHLTAGDQVIVIEGPSKAGKSRTAYEIIRRLFAHRVVIAPRRQGVTTTDLRRIFQSVPKSDELGPDPILWLDDLDIYLQVEALGIPDIRRWRKTFPGLQVVSTIRSEQYQTLLQSESASSGEVQRIGRNAAAFLRFASKATLHLPPGFSESEFERAEPVYGNVPRFDAKIGLGAALIGGPALLDKLMSGYASLPGVAVTCAAIDWKRCGFTRAASTDDLRALANALFPTLANRPMNRPMTDEEFALGIDWATQFVEPTYAGIALLVGDARGYEVLDYVVAYRDREDDSPFQEMVLEEVWRAAAKRAWPQEAMAVATSAAYRSAFDVSLDVLTEASNAADVAIVAESMSLKANVLFFLERFQEANDTLDELTQRLSDDYTPAIRGRLIAALLNKGLTLDQLDRHEDEIGVYDEIDRRFGADERPEIREQVAVALRNKALTLGQLDRPEEAIGVYDEIDRRFGADERPEIREQVAVVLQNKGVTLDQLARHEEEIGVYDELARRFGADKRPEIRDYAAGGLLN
jgi:tetratricopeptide (TPR) repeat protein